MEAKTTLSRGDLVEWRGSRYLVKHVTRWTVTLIGDAHVVRVRCLKPVAEGGLAEAVVIPPGRRKSL